MNALLIHLGCIEATLPRIDRGARVQNLIAFATSTEALNFRN